MVYKSLPLKSALKHQLEQNTATPLSSGTGWLVPNSPILQPLGCTLVAWAATRQLHQLPINMPHGVLPAWGRLQYFWIFCWRLHSGGHLLNKKIGLHYSRMTQDDVSIERMDMWATLLIRMYWLLLLSVCCCCIISSNLCNTILAWLMPCAMFMPCFWNPECYYIAFSPQTTDCTDLHCLIIP